VLGLIASTKRGVAILHEFGWESVTRDHLEVWPVHLPVDDGIGDEEDAAFGTGSLAVLHGVDLLSVTDSSCSPSSGSALSLHSNVGSMAAVAAGDGPTSPDDSDHGGGAAGLYLDEGIR